MNSASDPVATGLATDLAHPRFNATGITLMKAERLIQGIRFELLVAWQREKFLPSVKHLTPPFESLNYPMTVDDSCPSADCGLNHAPHLVRI
jgi:hypothetical protein